MTTNRTEDTTQAMNILVDAALRHMARTGCSLTEARDAAARWLYTTHPAIAAAITLQGA